MKPRFVAAEYPLVNSEMLAPSNKRPIVILRLMAVLCNEIRRETDRSAEKICVSNGNAYRSRRDRKCISAICEASHRLTANSFACTYVNYNNNNNIFRREFQQRAV